MSEPHRTLPFATEESHPSVRRINRAVVVRTEDDFCVVLIHGVPWHRFPAGSARDRRLTGAALVVADAARASEVLEPLGLNRATLLRDRRILLEEGLQGLVALRRGPKGPRKATPRVIRRARTLFAKGERKAAIARRLGVGESTVRRVLRDAPSQETLPVQTEVPFPGPTSNASAPDSAPPTASVPAVASSATEPSARVRGATIEARPGSTAEAVQDRAGFVPATPHAATTEADLDRRMDRVFARFGWITEADVRFVSGNGLLLVGALLLLPALVRTGFFRAVEGVYGRLKNGFYGLRHTVMTLALMMAVRRPRAEHVRNVCPAALGRLLGLDRAPEVKTLRRRLHEIAEVGKAGDLMTWFARDLCTAGADSLAFLYVDGHVRAYHGKHRISKSYVTQRRLAMPAANDLWVNDASGGPLLVVTGEVRSSLTVSLVPILKDVRGLLGPDARPTIAFDRGGWSPKLFRRLVSMGFDLLTYRKGATPRHPRKEFTVQQQVIDGRDVSYLLREGRVHVGKKLWMRSVVRLREDGKQTPILTTRSDLSGSEVAYRMFGRWRQENYFKQLGEQLDLDSLDFYAVEPDDPERPVPNPVWLAAGRDMAAIRVRIRNAEAELGRAVQENRDANRVLASGAKIAQAEVRGRIAVLQRLLREERERRKRVPHHVPLREARGKSGEPAVKLAVEGKHFLNILKMAVYRAETDLFAGLRRHYAAWEKEGRALLREAFVTSGSLEVRDGQLHVALDALSSPCRSRAIAGLCADLNAEPVRIPGTSLHLRFAVRGTN